MQHACSPLQALAVLEQWSVPHGRSPANETRRTARAQPTARALAQRKQDQGAAVLCQEATLAAASPEPDGAATSALYAHAPTQGGPVTHIPRSQISPGHTYPQSHISPGQRNPEYHPPSTCMRPCPGPSACPGPCPGPSTCTAACPGLSCTHPSLTALLHPPSLTALLHPP